MFFFWLEMMLIGVWTAALVYLIVGNIVLLGLFFAGAGEHALGIAVLWLPIAIAMVISAVIMVFQKPYQTNIS